MSYDIRALREREFPWAARGEAIYLNNASTGPVPARSLARINDFNERRTKPYTISDDDEMGTVRTSRELAARLIGASPEEIGCMVNTTYGINVAARSLPLVEGDLVLSYGREFPANVYPWMALERRGVRFEQVPCDADGLPDEGWLYESLDREGVKAVTVSWVQFATGYTTDLATLGRECHARGIYLVVDAIQGLGARTLDVRECHVDVLACGGQKWLLSPWGTGFVYVRKELIRRMEPGVVGWMATRGSEDFSRLVDYDFTYHDDARRFEVVTLPYQDFAGFNSSVELLLELGPDAVAQHVSGLVDIAVEWASCRRDVRLITPAEPARRAGIVAMVPKGDVRAASERLTRAKVAHALREGAIRLAPHCYNTEEEVRTALAVMVGERGA
ncbi:MAG TPA: aminotransferase class V-fold PLP-dependent enzyme [Gemmatimonadaceae bacterium]|nr:aminotransferase class V-fold PLP-dependent enzyme [Gemmatimonadaceae bacterium]